MGNIQTKNDWRKRIEDLKHKYEEESRATGRTTRFVDANIQKLFNNLGEFIFVTDHFNSNSVKSKHFMIGLIKRRIESEHPRFNVIVDKNLLIKLELKNK